MVVMKVKRAKAKKMIKIVYFDEGSATDFIYVLTGGKSTDKKEHIVTKSSELAVGAEAEASKSAGLFSMISAKIGVDVQYSPSQDKLKSSIDFLGLLMCDIQKQGDLVSSSVNNQEPVVTDLSGKSNTKTNSKKKTVKKETDSEVSK